MKSGFLIGAVLALPLLGACSTGQWSEQVQVPPVDMLSMASAAPSSAVLAEVCWAD